MSALEGIPALLPVRAVGAAARIAAHARGAARAGADIADVSTPPLRVVLGSIHEDAGQWHRAMAIVDSVDATIGNTQELLSGAREAAGRDSLGIEEAPLDRWLAAIDDAASRPFIGSAHGLRDGAVLVAGDNFFDVRPLGTTELGAVVASGRSLRLSDAAAGGPLDYRINQTGALRSIDAALAEVSCVRVQLHGFRVGSIVPALRDAMARVREATDTGPGSGEGMAAIGARMRGEAELPFASHESALVLRLVG